MDRLVTQYRDEENLSPHDMRLLNWHFANLEYANAVNVSQLSLGGWDQDSGNEFEGRHSDIVGGYSQVVRGLFKMPTQLDVQLEKNVEQVDYRDSLDGASVRPLAKIHCKDGQTILADHVVSTFSLGILQQQEDLFEPRLPDWKRGTFGRLGFGVLNKVERIAWLPLSLMLALTIDKVILVFDEPFWDIHRDMFGLLNQSEVKNSLAQEDYARNRGKFYLFWNTIKASGRPMLVALMAGDAALEAESTPQDTLITDVVDKLVRMFSLSYRPHVEEAIVTRWKQDPFARGTYSYLGPEAQPGDYEAMARSVGNLHFAGEATCGTHPATVHGAFISGLRAAAEVVEAMIGPVPAAL